MPTIERVEAEVEKINTSGILPPGVRVETIYDRSDLIEVTTHTVLHNMAFGMVLIFLLQWLFLGNLRSALIVATTIPFALFFAILIMVLRGESANLLSVGAIDFGLIVDATVIMVENIFRHLVAGRRTSASPDSDVHASRAAASGPARQIRRHRQLRDRGQPVDLLLGGDHHRRLRAAVHAVRHRGPYLRPDGQDLCLCHRRRPDRHLHRLAGAERAAAARQRGARPRPVRGPRLRRVYRPALRLRAGQPHPDAGRRRRCWW